jgi:hypothetical protein
MRLYLYAAVAAANVAATAVCAASLPARAELRCFPF